MASNPANEMTAEKEEWDCQFTYDVTWTKTPDGHDKMNEYVLLETLGSGSFGRVRLAERQEGERPFKSYAIKMMSKLRLIKQRDFVHTGEGGMKAVTALDKVRAEVDVLRRLWHRNVVLLMEVIEDIEGEGQELCLVMEALLGGCPMKYVAEENVFRSPATGGVCGEALARRHFRDLCKGLRYLRELGVCHRDIKPDNLLLTGEGVLRITDFGCAVRLEPERRAEGTLVDSAGTYLFYSPECCSGEPYSGYSNDLWAATVCLYIFLYGILPFQCEGIEPLFEMIQNEPIDLPLETLNADLASVIQNLFQKQAEMRMSIFQVLESRWLFDEQEETSNSSENKSQPQTGISQGQEDGKDEPFEGIAF